MVSDLRTTPVVHILWWSTGGRRFHRVRRWSGKRESNWKRRPLQISRSEWKINNSSWIYWREKPSCWWELLVEESEVRASIWVSLSTQNICCDSWESRDGLEVRVQKRSCCLWQYEESACVHCLFYSVVLGPNMGVDTETGAYRTVGTVAAIVLAGVRVLVATTKIPDKRLSKNCKGDGRS